jgi:hypothetical protein
MQGTTPGSRQDLFSAGEPSLPARASKANGYLRAVDTARNERLANRASHPGW